MGGTTDIMKIALFRSHMVRPNGIQFINVEPGPQSVPYSNTGMDWLDVRNNKNAFEGALVRLHDQKYLKELGEEHRIRPGSIAMSQDMGSKEREVPLRTIHYKNPDDPFSGDVVSSTPPEYLFRGMSEEEFQASKKQGFIKSDGRGALIPEWEGTNAGHSAGTAYSYLPSSGIGRIVKIRVHEDDKWFGNSMDNYARTRQQIPWDRVVSYTSPIDKSKVNTL